ncbi:phosphoenolpyruvate carboxykinase (ATP) [Gillisia sp. CAL575]|uniref:phosphoenolpyruvate carboxykinase (ATP) n=1 Tax=Gillisia sp. CAL575 TaxID=985255 RepID=UPI0003A75D24|nr:phosphoenolpyruvate carboxykinase (ATP) [Gillisia sp. CAL575]
MSILDKSTKSNALKSLRDKHIFYNLPPEILIEKTLKLNQGLITESGALAVNTGTYTGRSPKDKFIVKDEITKDTIWWGDVNQPLETEVFENLYRKVISYLENKDVYIRDSYVCASNEYRLNLKIVTETPWQNLFANNLFLRPTKPELENFVPDWEIIVASGFYANPEIDGTRQSNFTIINFKRKKILIGGSAYTGEIKKSVFTILNFILPKERKVLPMHCSANSSAKKDTAIFFGLSGTGKTTLSADPERELIGDDEHGWDDTKIFNFEGGCYAKCVNLTQEKEPQIFNAIKKGTLLENVEFYPGTNKVDYSNTSITENTRAAYPLHFINNAIVPSIGDIPKNIFFLTCDAFGILPPISKLTPGQAMYHFISGYTAKVAGTEAGINEPQATFSACFGEPFLPLHPTEYAEILGNKIKEHNVKVWLINTGWSGGEYIVGERIKLSYTRAMISSVLEGKLENAEYNEDDYFGLAIPSSCPNVPTEILDPRNTWIDKYRYDAIAENLASMFKTNFKKYSEFANAEILKGGPSIKSHSL